MKGHGHLLDIEYRVCMDWEYYLRLMREDYKFAYIPEAIAGFRWHGSNTSLVHTRRRLDEALKLQREHLSLREMPRWLGNDAILKVMRKIYQLRRVARRKKLHGRWH